jgi:protein TonB
MHASGEAAEKYPFATGSVRVRFRADMVSRLKRSVLRSVPAGSDTEIGGVLLGQIIPDADSSLVLDISDFMILPSSDNAGHGYRAPVEDVRRLKEGSSFGQGVRAIGYFRTQDDPDFRLRPHEAALTDEILEDSCLVLLLQPAGSDRVLAGLIHSGGGRLRRTPVKLFQFDEAAFGARQPVAVRPAAPPAPDPFNCVDSRLAENIPSSGTQRQLLRAGIVAVVALCAGAIAAYWWSDRFGSSRTESVRGGQQRVQPETSPIQAFPGAAQSSGLDISVNRTSDGVMVGWNGARALQATTGQLVITDGNSPSEIVPLGVHELQQGKVFYRGRSDRLRFRVELVDSMGRRFSDSVLVLGGSKAAESSEGIAQRTLTAATPEQPSESRQEPAPAASQPMSTRTFQPPPQSQNRLVERVIALDAPAPIHIGAPTPPNIAQTAFAPPIQPPVAAPHTSRPPAGTSLVEPAPAPRSEPLSAGPSKNSGTRQYTEPVALLQVPPRLDSTIRSVLVNDVEIEVKLQIDASGSVVQAQPVHSETGLRQHMERAAVEAAMRWRFKPASIDGTAVPSVTVVKFVFRR